MLMCAEPLHRTGWRGLPLLKLSVPPTEPAPLRRLERPLVMALAKGRVKIVARKGEASEVAPGDVSVLPAGADYDGACWTNTRPAEYLAVELPEDTCTAWLHRAPSWPRSGEGLARFSDPRVLAMLRELQSHAQQGEPLGSLYTEALSLALVACVDAQALATRVAQPSARHLRAMAPQAMSRLRKHIDERLAEAISVADMAQFLDLSPQHFARVFKASFGAPLHRYVLQCRVARAQQMLECSGETLAEVALACGFSSQAHLGWIFKGHTGMAPGQYRRCMAP